MTSAQDRERRREEYAQWRTDPTTDDADFVQVWDAAWEAARCEERNRTDKLKVLLDTMSLQITALLATDYHEGEQTQLAKWFSMHRPQIKQTCNEAREALAGLEKED